MPRPFWGTLAAAAVTAALAGCGSNANAGPASASEGGGSATPTSSSTTGSEATGTEPGSPGKGSPANGSPSTGTGGGSGTGTGTATGTGSGTGGGDGTSVEKETDDGAEFPRCTNDILVAHVTKPSGSVGNRYAYLVLTNNYRGPCFLRGWSELQLANDDGPVPTQVVREGDPFRILVPAGASAYERLHWTVVHTGDETGNPCQAEPTVLRVTPPDAPRPITAAWEHGPVCGHGTIRLTPVKLSLSDS